MAITRDDYLDRFHDVLLETLPEVLRPDATESDLLSLIVRVAWARTKIDKDAEEFAEMMLGEIFKASGRSYDAHQIKHMLANAGVTDGRDVGEKPIPTVRVS